MSTKFSVTKFLKWTIAGVVIAFVIYATLIIVATWPISILSLDAAGKLGDSFGFLTSLFTGLGFAGLLATVFLQREELKLNRRELKQTRKEIRLQSQTFHRQRFEDAFYQLLALYKENLRELSIRPHEEHAERIYSIDAMRYLLGKFEKAWGKHNLHKFPVEDDKRNEYLYVLLSTIQSVFVRQARYVETLSTILVLIDEECVPSEGKSQYWRIISSQLTVYEIKYLFYQALIAPDFKPLRNMMLHSELFQERLAILNIPDAHRKAFEFIWKISLPNKRTPFASPLSKTQIKMARKLLQKRRKTELENEH